MITGSRRERLGVRFVFARDFGVHGKALGLFPAPDVVLVTSSLL